MGSVFREASKPLSLRHAVSCQRLHLRLWLFVDDAFEQSRAELGVFALVRRGATGDGCTGRLVENLREIAWDGFQKARTGDEFLLSDAADMVYSSQSGSLDRRNLCRIR